MNSSATITLLSTQNDPNRINTIDSRTFEKYNHSGVGNATIGIVDEDSIKHEDVSGNSDSEVKNNANQPQEVYWRLENTFQRKEELDHFLNVEKCWSYRGCADTVQGQKVLYRCNKVKRSSKFQCAAGVYVITKTEYENGDPDDLNVSMRTTYLLYRKNTLHTHAQSPDMVAKLTDEVKELIIEQYKNGTKPKKIAYNLHGNSDIPTMEKPSHKQIVRVINAFKRAVLLQNMFFYERPPRENIRKHIINPIEGSNNNSTMNSSATITALLAQNHQPQRMDTIDPRTTAPDKYKHSGDVGILDEDSIKLEDNNGDDDQDDDSSVTGDSDSDEREYNVKQAQKEYWRLENTFQRKEELDQFLNLEKCWSYRGCADTVQGKKVLYRCNKVKRSSKFQCAAGVYVITKTEYESGDPDDLNVSMRTTYLLYRKNTLHTHAQSPDMVVKLTYEVKELIIEQYQNGKKPKEISYNLLGNSDIPKMEKPSHKQIIRVINTFKRSGCATEPLTMRQLSKFVEKHQQLPKDQDEAFVVRFEKSQKNVKDDKFFRFFISTPRLLRTVASGKIVNVDATHKVTTAKLPLIAVGVTDCNQKFHLGGITLANDESAEDYTLTFEALKTGVNLVAGVRFEPEVLVADADPAIDNGFKAVFGGDDNNDEVEGENNDEFNDDNTEPKRSRHFRIMCYFHVKRNIRKYKFKNAKNRVPFNADVEVLHTCDSLEKFENGCALFVKKWSLTEPEATRLLNESFFKINKNWFIGCLARAPKHNKCMEKFNSTMKRCQAEHQKHSMKQFLAVALSIVRQRSQEYLLQKASFETEMKISQEIFDLGIALNVNFVQGYDNPDGGVDFYVFHSDMDDRNITLNDVSDFNEATYELFDDFASGAFDIWKITFPSQTDQWKLAVCTCPSFDKHYMCKHIVSIALQLGILIDTEGMVLDYENDPLLVSTLVRPKHETEALVID